MKAVSNDYKSAITLMGRQFNAYIDINDSNGGHYNLEGNVINSISLSYDSRLYKTIMQQCIIDIDKDAYPSLANGVERRIVITFDLLINEAEDEWESITSGEYIVKDIEEQKDTKSLRITCYDDMLKTMVQYNGVDLTQYEQTTDTNYLDNKAYYKLVNNQYVLLVEGTDYEVDDDITGVVYQIAPIEISLKDYLIKICDYLGFSHSVTFNFPNMDRILTQDLYLDGEGASLGYTFRDVLDDIAEATGRFVTCTNGYLDIVTFNNTNETIDESYFKDINVDFGEKFGVINKLSLTRSADSDVIYRADETSIEANGETEISFADNQLLSQEDREDWIDAIFNEIKGTEFYLNDYASTGITYLEPLDRYNVSIGENTYSCVMLSDEVNITQGLEENVHTDRPDEATTDYATSSTTDRTAIQTTLIVNKQLGQIVGEVATKTDLSNLQGQIDANGEAIESLGTRVTQTESNITFATNTLNEIVDENGNVTSVKNSLVTINADGIQVQTNTSAIKTQMTNDAFIISDTTGQLARFDDDGANLDNLSVDHYLTMGVHRVEKYDNNTRTGFFYIGG